MSSGQFRIPRRAADALPIEGIVVRVRALGIVDPHLEYSTVHAGAGKMRIACSVDMAVILVDELRQLAERSEGRDGWLVIDCAYAVKPAFEAIERQVYWPGGKLDSGIRASLN